MAALTTTIDAIREYRPILEKYPVLSNEAAIELMKRYKNQSDLKAVETLVLSHLRLVIKIAKNFEGYGLPFKDLVQEGTIGMMKAVKNYDYSNVVSLASYAIGYIKGEITDFILSNWRIVKVATTKAHKKLFFNMGLLNSGICNSQIANELNVSEQDVDKFKQRFEAIGNQSDFTNINRTDYGSDHEFEWESSDDSYEPTNVLERNQHEWLLTEGIQNALKQLDERTQNIIQSRWLDEDPKTMKELSEIYGVSIARIGQIEQQGIKKLREILK